MAEGTQELELVEGHARQPLDLGAVVNQSLPQVSWSKVSPGGGPLGGAPPGP
ncbi:hypothetical protein [Actinomyces weissii]|uniref:Uncharacterized protein n=1 Tax=Actinomyces weissii TaxID=675090 RepID=A0A7T7S279_9ACTO|nr:hypothetical protein [Actinomyces weissii]QQM67741.1 hypothetical protein JG540_02335 [Actinomyces weissii]